MARLNHKRHPSGCVTKTTWGTGDSEYKPLLLGPHPLCFMHCLGTIKSRIARTSSTIVPVVQKLMEQSISLTMIMNSVLVGVCTNAHQGIKTEPICNFTLVAKAVYIPTHPYRLVRAPGFVPISTGFANASTFVDTQVSIEVMLGRVNC